MTEPLTNTKPRSPPKKRNDIVDIMPCFFDLQVQTAIKLLQMSSHTMMRIRKEMGLDRWPFERICRGKPMVWKGESMVWEDIQRFRTATIPLVSEEMQAVLHKCDLSATLMRAMYVPGYSKSLRAAKRRSDIKAFIKGVEQIVPVRVAEEETILPTIVVEEVSVTESLSVDDRQLLDEIGLLDFEPVLLEGWAPLVVTATEADDGYWPEFEASPEQEAYWSDVGRLLFECEPV